MNKKVRSKTWLDFSDDFERWFLTVVPDQYKFKVLSSIKLFMRFYFNTLFDD